MENDMYVCMYVCMLGEWKMSDYHGGYEDII